MSETIWANMKPSDERKEGRENEVRIKYLTISDFSNLGNSNSPADHSCPGIDAAEPSLVVT